MGSVTISADSIASLSVTLAAGTHSITAWYVGHANYLAATSTLVRLVVNPKLTPAVTGAASPNPGCCRSAGLDRSDHILLAGLARADRDRYVPLLHHCDRDRSH